MVLFIDAKGEEENGLVSVASRYYLVVKHTLRELLERSLEWVVSTISSLFS